MDAAGGRRLLSSIRKESVDLREAVTMVVRHICQQFVDPTGLDAFTACRLVALDKCPGIRPVGMGEVVRRIIAKAVLAAAGPQVQDANIGAVLLVDAMNAFNSLNRQVTLQNVLRLCPSIALAKVNTYRADAQLFVDGEVIYSREGTTQGDPLAIAMCAIATIPLIHKLDKLSQVKQVWFADDASAGGQLHQLKHWWDKGGDLTRLRLSCECLKVMALCQGGTYSPGC